MEIMNEYVPCFRPCGSGLGPCKECLLEDNCEELTRINRERYKESNKTNYTTEGMVTKELKLQEAVRLYIEAMKNLTLCRQDHFRQVCYPCKKYAKCLIYDGYVGAWMDLQEAYKKGEK